MRATSQGTGTEKTQEIGCGASGKGSGVPRRAGLDSRSCSLLAAPCLSVSLRPRSSAAFFYFISGPITFEAGQESRQEKIKSESGQPRWRT